MKSLKAKFRKTDVSTVTYIYIRAHATVCELHVHACMAESVSAYVWQSIADD